MNIYQKDDESLIDYTQQFKTTSDIFKSQLGSYIILEEVTKSIISNDMNYDPLNPDHVKRVKKEMHEAFLAYMYLQGSDHTKYGNLLKHLSSQFALGQDQFQSQSPW